jgi:transposase
MKRYIGIDVHGKSCTCVVLNARGKQVLEQKLETNGAALTGFMKSQPGELHVCLEESEWSEWLAEILTPLTAQVFVYQPVWRPGTKNDRIDARYLAELLRSGKAGCPVYKPPRRWSRLRELVRVDTKMTRDVVRTKQRLRGLFRRRGVSCRAEEIYDPRRRGPRIRKLPASLHTSAELLARQLDAIEALRLDSERAMLEEARHFAISKILRTVPGIGPKRAAELVAIVVTPHRFRTKRQFWSYCGLAIVTRTSSDWVRTDAGWQRAPVLQTRGLNKACNRPLKALFKGAATTVLEHSGPNPFREKYERLLEAGTRPNLAKLTIARTLAATVLAMWKTETRYRPMS